MSFRRGQGQYGEIMDGAALVQTGARIRGDRNFLLQWLRDFARAVRRMRDFPDDQAGVMAFELALAALLAFVEEDNTADPD